MIIRLMAVDPRPTPGKSDVVVYQVPENSREFYLLTEIFDVAHIDWTTLVPKTRKQNGDKDA